MDTHTTQTMLKKDNLQGLYKYQTVKEIDEEVAEADSTAISRVIAELRAEGKLPPKQAQK